MSYRDRVRDRLTEDQVGRMTDTSNGIRFKIATGRTWFVDGQSPNPVQVGASGLPYVHVNDTLDAAGVGDIVPARPGRSNEPQTILKPVTLRAPMTGPAIIGR